MKTIGVLGGLGPQATIDFEERVHQVAQRLIPQHGNQGYPPMVTYFFREPPVLMPADGSLPSGPPPINPRLLEAARHLGSLANLLAIPSNGVHIMQAEIERAAGRPLVSMVDAVMAEIQQRGYRRVGIVDFRPPTYGIYSRRLEESGVVWVALPDELTHGLFDVMLAVNEGRGSSVEEQRLNAAIAHLRARNVDGIILACTEFPLALSSALDDDIINPAEVLAEATVRAALE